MKPTLGIGVKIAHNILKPSIKDNQIDRAMTYATNANQKKPIKIARHDIAFSNFSLSDSPTFLYFLFF